MNVTIIDVAKKAGVSPSTVSRVISGHPRISPATVRKVKDIMEELGYHPNMMAKSLVSKTTQTIGLLLPRSAEELFLNQFFSEVIRGVVSQAARSEYDLMMTTGITEREEVEAVTRLVRGRRVDGVILLYSRNSDPVISFLKEERFPFVLIGRSEEHPDVLSVDNDNVQAAYDVTKHLLAQGHRRIGFVSGPPNLIVSRDRLEGYKQALADAEVEFHSEWIVEGEFLQESGYRAMSFFMTLPERPTALVVMDDLVAFGVLRGLTELGYKVPQDLSLIGFNNIPMSELASPPISSVDIGIYQLGYTASQTLIRAVKGEAIHHTRMIIPHRLIARESSLHHIQP
ncbi:LacI family DNA-binding transcriptional regulator [Paenibacillus validus]|uniref:LacI family DNA-binding transcriptional regulator n=1 Tax=Paenibacillus validus TaxID=44253 RepID=A0A7X2Z9Q5_9BACL|nr:MULTISPECIES: LacI family DNA-binding transcriptional regulator [Paenibacillus]MED4603224.1 LacI family DNA-binding transcriptional regulator [Paenibacillus validus]MED4608650.1 LacI family DNA-binding transcriptional regulator [Paenibacillus validus]MUG70866.1 LacI family DNA-binding transcriptional regulator [Paenibacillus validus]